MKLTKNQKANFVKRQPYYDIYHDSPPRLGERGMNRGSFPSFPLLFAAKREGEGEWEGNKDEPRKRKGKNNGPILLNGDMSGEMG